MSIRGVPEKDPSSPSNPEFPSRIVTEGLVSYWTMDNKDLSGSVPSATVKDIWGDNDGTTSGTITTGATGKINEALDFDGVDDYVSVGTGLNSVFDGGGSITVSAWVYADAFSTSDFQGIVAESFVPSNNVAFELCYDDVLSAWKAGFYDGSWHTVTGGEPSTGEWTHLVATYDGSTLILYVNGTQVDSLNDTAGLPAGDAAWAIGRRHDNFDLAASYWNGSIDEVHIYNRALSETEIRRNYLATRNKLGRGFPAQPIFP